MKNFLKKLHIVSSHAPEDVDPAPDQHKQPPVSSISNWLNSVTNKPTPTPPFGPEAGASSVGSSSETASSVRMRRVSLSTASPSSGAEASGSSMSSSSETVGSERARRESVSGAAPPAARELPSAEVSTTAASAPAATEEDDLEDYQLQLALELSAREDPEAVQIEVAKQISLGSCRVESTPAEVIAYRYWVSASSNLYLLTVIQLLGIKI